MTRRVNSRGKSRGFWGAATAAAVSLTLGAPAYAVADALPPDTPGNITITRELDSMVFTWDAVVASPSVTTYDLLLDADSIDPITFTVDAPETAIGITDFAPGETYTYQVRAVNAEGASAYSAVQEFTWTEQVVNMTATLSSGYFADVGWSLAVPATASYIVFINDEPMRFLDGTSTQIPLLPGTHTVDVLAMNVYGDEVWAATVMLTVVPPARLLFSDVATSSTFYEETFWMAQAGVTGGYDDGTYRPSTYVTRGQMAAFLFRFWAADFLGLYTPPALALFSDVPLTYAFFTEIAWLAQSGITGGYSDGTFRPADRVTRGQMAAFLYRMSDVEGYAPPPVAGFPDVPVSHAFYTEISWLAATGITGGYGDGTFRPSRFVNRGEMAAFLYRYAHPVFALVDLGAQSGPIGPEIGPSPVPRFSLTD